MPLTVARISSVKLIDLGKVFPASFVSKAYAIGQIMSCT